MRARLPLILSMAALVVALFGATPLGHVARKALHGTAAKAAVVRAASNPIRVRVRSKVGTSARHGDHSEAIADCKSNETLTGGGGGASYIARSGAKGRMEESQPTSTNTSWQVDVRNDGSGGTVYAVAYALCAY